MNARQKAKHYKQQLNLLKVPVTRIIDKTELKHYKIRTQMPLQIIATEPARAMSLIRDDILYDMIPIIDRNIKEKTAADYRHLSYEVDIWTMN